MATRCSFCNNAVLEFQIFTGPNGKTYHKKCYDQAQQTKEEPTPEQIEAHKKKVQEEFDKQPKMIGAVEVGGKPGFVINPKTGAKKYVGSTPGTGKEEQ